MNITLTGKAAVIAGAIAVALVVLVLVFGK